MDGYTDDARARTLPFPAAPVPQEYRGEFTVEGVTFDLVMEVFPVELANRSLHPTIPVPLLGPFVASWRCVSRATGAVTYPSAPKGPRGRPRSRKKSP